MNFTDRIKHVGYINRSRGWFRRNSAFAPSVAHIASAPFNMAEIVAITAENIAVESAEAQGPED